MGQIVGGAAKPKRCNLNKLSQLGTPAAGEYILVSSDNSMNAAGQGNFDRYIIGDGRTAAAALELKYLDDSTHPYIVEEVNKAVADIQPIEITGDVTNAPDEEDLTSENQGGTDVLKFKDKAYNAALYSGLGRVYLRKNIVTLEGTGKNVLTQAMVNTANTIYHIQYDYDLNGQTITLPAGCVLEFEGGSVKDGTLIGNGTRIIGKVEGIFKNDISISGTWNVEHISTEMFDDYSSDNLIALGITNLQNDSVHNTIDVTRDLSLDVNEWSYNIGIKSNANFNLYGDITLNASAYGGGYVIYVFATSSNVIIDGHGHTLYGEKTIHTGASGEYIHGISVQKVDDDVASDIEIKNLTCQEFWGDGIYIYANNVHIDNVILDNNRRQGMTIANCQHVLVENSKFTNTGSDEIVVSPGAGIDIEEYPIDHTTNDITIRNCILSGNYDGNVWSDGVANDLSVMHSGNNINVENCTIGNVVAADCDTITIKDSVVSGCLFAATGITLPQKVVLINSYIPSIHDRLLPLVEFKLQDSSLATFQAINSDNGVDLSYRDVNGLMLPKRYTENCYVVKETGTYKFPLVYGTSIRKGVSLVVNELGLYVNHLGNALTSPFIEENANCVADSGEVVWQTIDGMISDVSLVEGTDCRYLSFKVNSVPTTGANAVIGIKDSNDDFMWSWHIWVFPDTISTVTVTNHSSDDYVLMDTNLGWIWDDDTKARGTAAYYQWGRKDPMPNSTVYNENVFKTTYGTHSLEFVSAASSVTDYIKYPYAFFQSLSTTTGVINYLSWNSQALSSLDPKVYKSLFDPCPVGFCVPRAAVFSGLTTTGVQSTSSSEVNSIGSFSGGSLYKKNSDDTEGFWLSANGYVAASSAAIKTNSSVGMYWENPLKTAGATAAKVLYLQSGLVAPSTVYSVIDGMVIRPQKEEV